MHRFFVQPSQVGEDTIVITGGDVNHIRNVLRMKPGEELIAADGQGAEYRCRLSGITDQEARAEILWKLSGDAELPVRITLYQGLPKSDKMDFIVQKCVELGVSRIVPVDTARTVVKLDAKKEQNRRNRWSAIAESAAKQSGRGIVPEIGPVLSFKAALAEAEAWDRILIPYERAENMAQTRSILTELQPGMSVGIFIGPEGGFEETEVEAAEAAGARAVTLGRRILRTETAGMALLAMLGYLLEP